jgi:HK97 family phage portal protein
VTVGRPVPTPPWLRDPMLLREDGRISGSVQAEVVQLPRSGFWFSWIRDALWHGLGAFLFEPDQSGQPTAGTLRLIDSRYLYTTRVGQALHWTLDSGSDDPAVFDRDGFITLGAVTYRIVVLRNPHSPVDAEGMSLGVFGLAPGAFKLSGQIAAYASGTFRSGIPAGYLKVNTPGLTQEVASDLKRRWMASHGGDRRAIAVLNATTEFVPMNFSPVDAALGEMTRLSVADVAYAFGLAPDNLGVSLSGSATYSNVRDHFQALRDFGLAPWIAAVQEVLSALLPGSAGVVVNLDGFANPPLSERVATGAQAVAAGLLTTDEWRALEGLPPLPEPPPTPEPELPAPEEEPEPQRHLRIQPWRGG